MSDYDDGLVTTVTVRTASNIKQVLDVCSITASFSLSPF